MALIHKDHVGPRQVFTRLAAIANGGFVKSEDVAEMRCELAVLEADGLDPEDYKGARRNMLVSNINRVRRFQGLTTMTPVDLFVHYRKKAE